MSLNEVPLNWNLPSFDIYICRDVLGIFNAEKDTQKGILSIRGTNKGLFELNLIDCFPLFGRYEISVNLGGCYWFVSKHLRDRINVSTCGNLKGGVGMSEAMEGDMLLNAGSLYPVLERDIDHWTCKTLKDLSFTSFSAKSKSLVAYRENGFSGCLLGSDSDAWAFIGSNTDIVPCQVLYIADTKPGETWE